uniref:Uncharacterized protein n=1 Tax=Arundo donax TaxID=35708 RepID=A0A0A9G8B1_ARUDO
MDLMLIFPYNWICTVQLPKSSFSSHIKMMN